MVTKAGTADSIIGYSYKIIQEGDKRDNTNDNDYNTNVNCFITI